VADFQIHIREIELVLSLETDYIVSHTDWYEWRENAMKTFLQRVHDEIVNDGTISAYLDGIATIYNDDLARYDVGALLEDNLIIIHTVRDDTVEEEGGSGRDNVVLNCEITAYVRRGTGLDADGQEIGLVGDGTADKPGTLEIMEDLRSLFRNNYLVSGGQKYLWDMKLGEITTPDDLSDLEPGVSKATLPITGFKWDILW
jgi:hypothetical protein